MEQLDPKTVFADYGLAYFRELATFGALSDEAIQGLVECGEISRLQVGERIERYHESAEDFQIVLAGRMAFYKCSEQGEEVFTRYFNTGDQIGFDLMIGLIPHNGVDVAEQETVLLSISKLCFYQMHEEYPGDFGLLMINLARELSREIALLEDVIVSNAQALSPALALRRVPDR